MQDTIEWVQLSDGSAGKTYFWNRRTHVSLWLALEGMKVVWVGTRDEGYDLPPLPPGPEEYMLCALLVSVVCTPLSASSGSRHST